MTLAVTFIFSVFGHLYLLAALLHMAYAATVLVRWASTAYNDPLPLMCTIYIGCLSKFARRAPTVKDWVFALIMSAIPVLNMIALAAYALIIFGMKMGERSMRSST